MTRNEHLLTILAEECNEVAQRCSKAIRFGLEEIQPEQEYNNAERIMHEIADLISVLHVCQESGLVPRTDANRLDAKTKKLVKYMSFSETMGTIK